MALDDIVLTEAEPVAGMIAEMNRGNIGTVLDILTEEGSVDGAEMMEVPKAGVAIGRVLGHV